MLSLKVRLMAGHAVVGCGRLEERIHVGHRMTRRAVQEVVIADQGEPAGQCDVISLCPRPSGGRVTGQAGVGIAGPRMFSLKVRLVAGHAVVGCGRLEERIHVGHRMTRRAVQEVVIADQGEPAGQGDVISLCPRPSGGRVTGQAGVGIAGPRMFSLKVRLMAGHAVVGCGRLEERIHVGHRVTRRAVQEPVVADEGEPT